jgi:hypothetical protein
VDFLGTHNYRAQLRAGRFASEPAEGDGTERDCQCLLMNG